MSRLVGDRGHRRQGRLVASNGGFDLGHLADDGYWALEEAGCRTSQAMDAGHWRRLGVALRRQWMLSVMLYGRWMLGISLSRSRGRRGCRFGGKAREGETKACSEEAKT